MIDAARRKPVLTHDRADEYDAIADLWFRGRHDLASAARATRAALDTAGLWRSGARDAQPRLGFTMALSFYGCRLGRPRDSVGVLRYEGVDSKDPAYRRAKKAAYDARVRAARAAKLPAMTPAERKARSRAMAAGIVVPDRKRPAAPPRPRPVAYVPARRALETRTDYQQTAFRAATNYLRWLARTHLDPRVREVAAAGLEAVALAHPREVAKRARLARRDGLRPSARVLYAVPSAHVTKTGDFLIPCTPDVSEDRKSLAAQRFEGIEAKARHAELAAWTGEMLPQLAQIGHLRPGGQAWAVAKLEAMTGVTPGQWKRAVAFAASAPKLPDTIPPGSWFWLLPILRRQIDHDRRADKRRVAFGLWKPGTPSPDEPRPPRLSKAEKRDLYGGKIAPQDLARHAARALVTFTEGAREQIAARAEGWDRPATLPPAALTPRQARLLASYAAAREEAAQTPPAYEAPPRPAVLETREAMQARLRAALDAQAAPSETQALS